MLLQKVVILIVIGNVLGFDLPWMFMGRPISGFRQVDTNITKSKNASDPQFFNQILDHFNSTNTNKWKQRFWYSNRFDNGNGTQILILGGEYAASENDVFYELYPHVQYAKEVGAGLWTLEHRFYGQSQPFGNLETKNLAYLSSRQALEDIAFFIRSQNTALNITNPKWVLIGGSYAGSLALWLRQKYPALTVGAVASCAPVQPVFDFHEHIQHVEAVLNATNVACFNDTRTSFQLFNSKVSSSDADDREDLSDQFSIQPDLSEITYTNQNMGLLYSILISYYQIAVQYNHVNTMAFRDSVGINLVCTYATYPIYGKIDAVNIAYIANAEMNKLEGHGNSINIDYPAFIGYLQDVNFSNPDQASTRAWLWQACTEFGYFPTTSGGYSIFPNNVSISFYTTICSDVFGAGYNKSIAYSNAITTKDYNGTNVVASRSSNDPWSVLALSSSRNPTVFTFPISDIGHCGDMAETSGTDSTSLMQYRQIVLENIKHWIGF